MPDNGNQSRVADDINRRKLLTGIGAAAGVALAGCGGNQGNGNNSGNGGDSDDLGERVPSFSIPYWSNVGGDTQVLEDIVPIIQESLNGLGLEVEPEPVEFTTQVANMINDERTSPLPLMYYTSSPERLDTHNQLQKFVIQRAGAGGNNMPHYTSCTYTDLARQEGSAPSEERRMEISGDAWENFSTDIASIPLINRPAFGAARTDAVEVEAAGIGGIANLNPSVFIHSQPSQGDSFTVNVTPVMLQTTNFPVLDSFPALAPWNNIIHSPLYQFDESYELQPVLAADRKVENDGRRVVIELKDSTFHNGDPVTAEDAKFTYEHLINNSGVFSKVRLTSDQINSIEAVDEKTIAFNFKEPFLPFIRVFLTLWGVLHKDTWVEAGATENPQEVDPGVMVGSGPFEISNLELGQSMVVKPHDGHAVYQPDHDIIFQVYRDVQTAERAFQSNEIQMFTAIPPGRLEQIKENENAETFTRSGYMPYILWPQMQIAPTKFREFRMAIGQSLDRQKINQIALYGESEPQLDSTFLASSHPMYSDFENGLTSFTDAPQGNVEAARQTLSEAGWNWDDDGNLHFPPDADLSPKWPQGEKPSPDDFPCIDTSGEYVPPEER